MFWPTVWIVMSTCLNWQDVLPRCIAVQFSSVAQLCLTLWPHGLQHARPPCPSPTPRACSNSCPSSPSGWHQDGWMPSNHLILCHPLLLLPSILPSIRVFSSESVLHIRWPKDWSFSFSSIFPMNIQDWFPLGWTSWISLQSKGLSRVFSNTTVQKHQSCCAQLSLWSNSLIHTWPLEKP